MTKPSRSPLGCVLAGGRSSRMGRDKALLPLHGVPLVVSSLDRLRALGLRPVIAGARPDLAQYATVVPDLHPGCGPLGGIEAALAAAGSPEERVLFLPVDLPLLPEAFLALLMERAERTGALATIPVFAGRAQPLCAVYRAALLPGIAAALATGDYKVMRVVDSLTSASTRDLFQVEAALAAQSILLDRATHPLYRWFENINAPEDLLRAEALA